MTEGFLNKSIEEIKERFNISQETVEHTSLITLPNQHIKVESWYPVITADLPSSFQIFQWGFVLFWMPGTNLANRTINAAVETAFDKPAFKEAITFRRCIIPIDGFYEHRLENGQRKKYRITRKDDQTFAVAGMWEQFPDPKGISFNAFLPLTHESNDFMKSFNKRMPFILSEAYEELWVDRAYATEDLLEIIEPVYHDILKATQVD